MTDIRKDFMTAVIFLVFGIFLYVQSLSIKTIVTSNYEVGSGFVPRIIAVLIIAIAVLLLFSAIFRVFYKKNDELCKSKKKDDLKGGVGTILLLICYGFIFDKLGFLLSTFIYLFFQIFLLSNKENRNIKSFLLISLIATIAVYTIFHNVFKLQLPSGIINI